MATCDSCGALIVWATTTNKTRIPLEGQRLDDGRLVPATFEDGNLTYADRHHVVVAYVKAGQGAYKTHFASCPQAGEWRKKR